MADGVNGNRHGADDGANGGTELEMMEVIPTDSATAPSQPPDSDVANSLGILVVEKPKSKEIPQYTGRPGEQIGFKLALRRSRSAPYLYANFVYVVYALLILLVDINPQWDLTTINNMFVGAAVVHVINAGMYVYVWLDEGFPVVHPIMIPECLNILEATLYLCTAVMYRYEYTGSSGAAYSSEESAQLLDYSAPFIDAFMDILNTTDPSNSTNSGSSNSTSSSLASSSDYAYYYGSILHDVECIELTASIIEFLAACGWVTSWYYTYVRVPGRGFTFDDPDTWANLSIVTPAVIYIVYNVQLQVDPTGYGTNLLYINADKIYMANSLLYFTAALRDQGWFWFMPTAGKFPAHNKPYFERHFLRSTTYASAASSPH